MKHYYWVAAELRLGPRFIPNKAWVTHVFAFNKQLLTEKDIDEVLYPRFIVWARKGFRKIYNSEFKCISYLGSR